MQHELTEREETILGRIRTGAIVVGGGVLVAVSAFALIWGFAILGYALEGGL